jgi:hypothetical protein
MCPFLEAPEGLSAEAMELLDRTFAATWRDVQSRRASSAPAASQEVTKAAIAKAIMDLAATGVREPERLLRHGLRAAEKAWPHTGRRS